jgi:hypothetical protein
VSPISAGLASLLGVGGAGRALGTPAAPARSAGALDFARLLEQAQAAELESGRQVTVGRGVHVSLSDEQLARVAAAADRAEAAGAITAAVLIDGEALVMDVAARTITGRLDVGAGEAFYGVDTIVSAPPEVEAPIAGPPAALHTNPSLLEALQKRSA